MNAEKIMTLLKKHLTEAMIGLLLVTSFLLYLILVKPIASKKQVMIKKLGKAKTQLQQYQEDPPSPELIALLTKEREILENQRQEVMTALPFPRLEVLPEHMTAQLPLYFEEQIEKAENELKYLKKASRFTFPDRLGFKREQPQTREELSALLNQLTAARELISLIATAKTSNLSTFIPLPLNENRFVKISDNLSLEEFKFQLEVEADILGLVRLVHALPNHTYSFTVKYLQIDKTASKVTRRGDTSKRVDTGKLRTILLVSTYVLPEEAN